MKKNAVNYILDAQALREILEYSSKFYENRFYVVIDAESFEEFDCFQLAYDLLLITNFCQVKLVIIVGCFCSRVKTHKKKRMGFLRQILAVVRKLENYFNSITMVGINAPDNSPKVGYCSFKPEEAIAAAEERSITIVPAVKFEDSKPTGVADVNQVISGLSSADSGRLFSKVIIVSSHDGIYDLSKNFLPQITFHQARNMVKEKIATGQVADIMKIALYSIGELGIERVHIVNGRKSGGLLVELYTKKGFGTMIYRGNYEVIRPAKESDATGIYSLILHYAKREIIQQSFDDIRRNFADFIVATIDGHVVACARLRYFAEEGRAFINSVVVNPHYIRQGIGKKLLAEMEKRAIGAGMNTIVLVGLDWWLYHGGFQEGDISGLPEAMRKDYAQGGNPKKVLIKKLS